MPVSWINSKTEICNLALGMIGDKRIQAFEDTSDVNSRLCRGYYDQVRDALLRSALWSFATTRAVLAQYATAPAFGWDYQYVLPSDYLRMVSLNDTVPAGGTDEFIIEMIGELKLLLTDADTASIRYIFRSDTPATYDAIFVRAFAAQLAADMSFEITGDARLTQTLYDKADRDQARAVHENANETKPTVKLPLVDSGLVRARLSSSLG